MEFSVICEACGKSLDASLTCPTGYNRTPQLEVERCRNCDEALRNEIEELKERISFVESENTRVTISRDSLKEFIEEYVPTETNGGN